MQFFIKIILLLTFLIKTAQAGFYFQHSFHYGSDADDVENLESTAMRNISFLGAGFGDNGRWIVGQSIILSNKEYKNDSMTSTSSLSLLELGPRIQYYFNQNKTVYISGAYNFYAKGDREQDGQSQKVSGTSMFFNLGIQSRISKKFYFGLSLNYHTVSIDESTVETTQSTVSHSYTFIYPAVEFSLRFK